LSYLTLFNESFARVVLDPSRLEQLVSCFYAQFLARSQRAQELFEHVDMDKQRASLRGGLLHVGSFVSTGMKPTSGLRSIAASHQAMHLTRADYDLWLECLVDAVGEVDPPARADVADAWRIALAPAISFLLLSSSLRGAS
jgi:hemoglobin-like flavoprotein